MEKSEFPDGGGDKANVMDTAGPRIRRSGRRQGSLGRESERQSVVPEAEPQVTPLLFLGTEVPCAPLLGTQAHVTLRRR